MFCVIFARAIFSKKTIDSPALLVHTYNYENDRCNSLMASNSFYFSESFAKPKSRLCL